MSNPSSYFYVMGPRNAEDLAPVPNTPWFIASGMADAVGGRGGLYVVDRRTRVARAAWSDGGLRVMHDPAYSDFGTPVAASALSAHGLHLEPDGGEYLLYVVNHGERESIELFSISVDDQGPSFTWIGAIAVPYPSHGNAVALLRDGTIVMTVTHQLNDSAYFRRIERGENTGYLLRWHPQGGWARIDGSDTSCPNGLLAARDGKTIYVACTGGRGVARMQLQGAGRDRAGLRDTVDIGFAPDNIRWNEDGSICAAGFATVRDPAPRACRVNPETLEFTPIALPPHTPEFERVATAVEIDRELWLSPYLGDRIAVLERPS